MKEKAYNEQDKRDAVRLYKFHGVKVKQIADMMGVSIFAVYDWNKIYKGTRNTSITSKLLISKMMGLPKADDIEEDPEDDSDGELKIGSLEGVVAKRQKTQEGIGFAIPSSRVFITKSIALAAYFLMRGYQVMGVKESDIDSKVRLFIFEESDELIADSKRYFSGEAEGSLRDFYSNIMEAKRILFSVGE